MVVTVDLGYAKKGRDFAARIDTPIAFVEKRRVANDARAEALTIIGDVKDRDIILVDDEIDTGRSIAQAVNLIKENGAQRIYVTFVHPIFSGGCRAKTGGFARHRIHHHRQRSHPNGKTGSFRQPADDFYRRHAAWRSHPPRP